MYYIFKKVYRNILYSIVIGVLTLSFQIDVKGQETVKIKRITDTIVFDGMPEESEWGYLDRFPLTMQRPNFGNQPSEKSDVWIGYDDHYLWVGARLYMRDASKIYEATKKRDEMLFDYDAFGIVLDTYDDKKNGLAFFTAPTGLRTDYAISNDASGGGPGPFGGMNTDWNTFWDVKTTVDDKGWYVEMRIPFSSLKFQPIEDLTTMGLIVSRNISANNETDTWPAIDPKYGFNATNKPSLAGTITFEGIQSSKPVYVAPYVLGGFSRNNSLNETETEYVTNDKPAHEIGLDVKYNVTSDLTLDVTVNTDFAQVEADNQQVNLTRYSLFFPEKRAFFQERADLFSYSLGGFSDNLFYSRNIGIADGQPVRIFGGARLVGRVGKWDMGIMDLQTQEHNVTPSENFGILRLRRQVINPNSFVGGIFTSRLGMNGEQNYSYGLDGIYRIFGDDYVSVKWAQTYNQVDSSKLLSLDPSFILLNWERRSEEGFAYNASYTYLGQKFNPASGFLRRNGVWGIDTRLLYGWIPGEDSKFYNYNVNIGFERYTRLEDKKVESMQISPGFEINTKKGLHAEISAEMQEEGVTFDFPLTDSILISAGDYIFTGLNARFGTSESRKFSMRGNINGGQFYNGQRYGFSVSPNYVISSSLQLSGSYELNYLKFPSLNQDETIHNVSGRINYMMSTKLSASVLVQYVTTTDDLIGNFRLRYNPREGNDLYIVYNEYRFAGNTIDMIPAPPNFYNRTILVKYVYTFQL